MSWEAIETAVREAISLAASVEQVRPRRGRRGWDLAQRVELLFEIETVAPAEDAHEELGDGLDPLALTELEVAVRISCLSQSHLPDRSALELSYRLLTRSHLPHVRERLLADGLVLQSVTRSAPAVAVVDGRQISAQELSWILGYRACENEGPPGAPRPRIDRIEVEEPRRAVRGGLVPEGLAALGWRSLWLGTQTDHVSGHALADHEDLAHNVDPTVPIGSGELVRFTSVGSAGVAAAVSDPDVAVPRADLALALVLRGPAPDARARVLSRLAPGGASGYALDALPDGSLELVQPAGATISAPGVLDGSTWIVAVAGFSAAQARLVGAGSDESSALTSAYADVPLVLGASEGVSAPTGLELALLGELDEDPAALEASLRALLGL